MSDPPDESLSQRHRSRRHLLGTGAMLLGRRSAIAAGAAVGAIAGRARAESPAIAAQPRRSLVKPPALQPGDVIGLASPASPIDADDLAAIAATLTRQGFRVQPAPHVLARYGYLAGRDRQRADDLNGLFCDDRVRAIVATRGGWGCNRLLPLLDWDAIRDRPKILVGYSDITTLLLALQARTGLVTFHGPVGISTWNDFSWRAFRSVLVAGETGPLPRPAPARSRSASAGEPASAETDDLPGDCPTVLHPGKARGRLLGGNLSVLASMVGSDYLPDWDGAILFLEEIGEDPYRVDRLLVQLALAGILDRLAGFVFGQCTDCRADPGSPSLTLRQILQERIAPLGIPAFYGAPLGHVADKWTLPVGLPVELDADAGTIALLEPAVALPGATATADRG